MCKLNQLEPVELTDIIPTQKYLLSVEPYSRHEETDTEMYIGTTHQVLEKLKDIFDYNDFIEDEDNDLPDTEREKTKAFLEHAHNLNGDGWDYVQLFKI